MNAAYIERWPKTGMSIGATHKLLFLRYQLHMFWQIINSMLNIIWFLNCYFCSNFYLKYSWVLNSFLKIFVCLFFCGGGGGGACARIQKSITKWNSRGWLLRQTATSLDKIFVPLLYKSNPTMLYIRSNIQCLCISVLKLT